MFPDVLLVLKELNRRWFVEKSECEPVTFLTSISYYRNDEILERRMESVGLMG